MRFNTWSDTSGFVDESRNQDFHEFVHQKENLFRWGLSDDHLTLSIGILPEDTNNKKWKPINNEWQDVLPNFKSVVREKAREAWLDELAKLCEKRFDQDYRGVGVRSFYNAKLKARKEHAREIRRHIEEEMFSQWNNGVRSAFDVSRLLAALLDAMDERRKLVDDKTTQMKDNEDTAANRVRVTNKEWAHMGFLQKAVLGKPDSLLDAQGEALQEQYIYRTRIEALIFSKQLMEDIVAEITDLKSEVDKCASTAAAAVKKYNDRLAERVTDDGKIDLREQLVRFYNPDLVRRVSSNLVKDENEQRTQTARVRQALTEKLGEHPKFSIFNQRIAATEFIDVLDKECAKNAQIAHNNLVVNAKEKLLGVSIIDRLKDRYGSDAQELRSYVTELVGHAGNYLTFDASEVHKIGPGIPNGVLTAVSKMSVIVPKAPEQAEFAAKLKDAFQGARGGDVEIIDSDAKLNEITLISLTNLFPLRYVRQVAFLKEKYDQKLKGSNAARAKLELHLEGDGSQHPRIFVPLQEEMRRNALPYLLIAKALGLIREETSSRTGGKGLIFVSKDEAGLDTDPIDLGKILTESLAKIDLEGADLIRSHVNRVMENECTQDAQRADLQKRIVSEVDQIKSARGNNVSDEIYRQFLEGGRLAVKIIRPES